MEELKANAKIAKRSERNDISASGVLEFARAILAGSSTK
jgi:hypothetical protein